jgi:hypothetical protein
MIKDEALKLALEALEKSIAITMANIDLRNKAITAIKQALAASVQEPVAWRVKVETKLRDGSVDVGYQLRNEKLSVHDEPLYTTPPTAQRQWVVLTDEERTECIFSTRWSTTQLMDTSKAIEAKLKEKNT